jgi:hypothetical protein
MNINLTFNEERYDFNLCLGKADKNGDAYLYYKIYINGELNTSYSLEEGTISSKEGDEKIFILYWKSFASSVYITNLNDLEEIVKVITYINKNK